MAPNLLASTRFAFSQKKIIVKIFVLVGCAQNPEEKIYAKNDEIVCDASTRLINDFDLIGVEAAVHLMEQGAAEEVTVFSLNADKTLIHKALAIGASRAILAERPDNLLSPGIVVREAVKACGDDVKDTLFICGRTNVNFEMSQVGQRLAQAVGCPCVCSAQKITPIAPNTVEVACESDYGTPIYEVKTPAVITTDLRLAVPRFPSLPNIVKAKRKPIISVNNLNLSLEKWDYSTNFICEAHKSENRCQFICVEEAVQVIKNAQFAAMQKPMVERDANISTLGNSGLELARTQQDAPVIVFITFQEINAVRRKQIKQIIRAWDVNVITVGLPGCNTNISLDFVDEKTPAPQIAEAIARSIRRFNIAAILSAHAPLELQVMAELAASAHIPFITGLYANLERYICAGRFSEQISLPASPFCATLADTNPLMFVQSVAANLTFSPFHVPKLKQFIQDDAIQSLEDAKLVFSVGRGASGYVAKIAELAQKYNAVIGASRLIVDMAMVDHSHQIGLTGHSVSPNLYVAFGISGAIQHVAGIRNAPRILAINTDKNAPIFEYAHLGVIADVYEIIQRL